ncbi:hypothetical protein [Streptomyces sp. YIM S03343]
MTDPVTRFTFPSGTTVDLPAGMIPCAHPEAVTYNIGRYVPVGVTPAGRQVLSGFSCGAYGRAAHVLGMREADAELRARADVLERRGLTIKAGNLRRLADEAEAKHAAIAAAWAADPAPCTCPQG